MAKEPKERFDKAMGLANALAHAWDIDDADEIVVLKSGALRREGETEPLPMPAAPSAVPAVPPPVQSPVAAPREPSGVDQRVRPRERRGRQRISPMVLIALIVALVVLGGLAASKVFNLNVGSMLRAALGRPAQNAEELVVATATPLPSEFSELDFLSFRS